MYESGMIVLCAFVSPVDESRRKIRKMFPADSFFEIYCKCAIEICELRDPKGFYAKARAGIIADYTGVSANYEEPASPELILETSILAPESCATKILGLLRMRDVLPHGAN